MYGPHTIPSVGPVELSWVANAPQTGTTPSLPTDLGESKGPVGEEGDVNSESFLSSDHLGARKDGGVGNEVDYDVAEEDDNWGVQ